MIKRKYLIPYFSWSGHTRKVARRIAALTGGTLFEIKPVKKYSRIYPLCAVKAKMEHDKNKRPKIQDKVADFDTYTDIIIGYPAWWYTCPMIILSFIEQYDFSGKTVRLFNTHMGSGSVGTSDVRKYLGDNIRSSMDANNLKDEKIKQWLGLE